jgi:hypothetical protein
MLEERLEQQQSSVQKLPKILSSLLILASSKERKTQQVVARFLLISRIHRSHQWELLESSEQTPIDAGDRAPQRITLEIALPDIRIAVQFPEQKGFDQGILGRKQEINQSAV